MIRGHGGDVQLDWRMGERQRSQYTGGPSSIAHQTTSAAPPRDVRLPSDSGRIAASQRTDVEGQFRTHALQQTQAARVTKNPVCGRTG
jgi:hypothetical protein